MPYAFRFYATNAAGDHWSAPAAAFRTPYDQDTYAFRAELTFCGYDRTNALTDFPALVMFFLSEAAGYVTGQTISVSGGLSMHG